MADRANTTRAVMSGLLVLIVSASVGASPTVGSGSVAVPDPDLLSAVELERRFRVQDQLPEFEERVRWSVAGFGGIYRDTAGTIVIGATSDSLEAARVVARHAPAGPDVRVVEVLFTLDELLQTQSEIRDDRTDLAAVGAEIYTVGIDVRQNRVSVTLAEVTDAIEGEFADRYGNKVVVTSGDAPQPTSCTGRGGCADPLKGGLKVVIGAEGCSSGFLARWSGTIYIISAGHCGVMGSAWKHNNIVYGSTAKRAYYDGSTVDASAAKINANQVSDDVFKGSLTSFFDVMTVQDYAGNVGDVVCLSARSQTSWDCGYIDDVHIDVRYENRTFVDQTRTTAIEALGGDSGGAIFKSHGGNSIGAVGIETAASSSGTVVYYSKIGHVQQELVLLVCTLDNC